MRVHMREVLKTLCQSYRSRGHVQPFDAAKQFLMTLLRDATPQDIMRQHEYDILDIPEIQISKLHQTQIPLSRTILISKQHQLQIPLRSPRQTFTARIDLKILSSKLHLADRL